MMYFMDDLIGKKLIAVNVAYMLLIVLKCTVSALLSCSTVHRPFNHLSRLILLTYSHF